MSGIGSFSHADAIVGAVVEIIVGSIAITLATIQSSVQYRHRRNQTGKHTKNVVIHEPTKLIHGAQLGSEDLFTRSMLIRHDGEMHLRKMKRSISDTAVSMATAFNARLQGAEGVTNGERDDHLRQGVSTFTSFKPSGPAKPNSLSKWCAWRRTSVKRTLNPSPLSHPLSEGRPLLAVSGSLWRPARCVVACSLESVWSAIAGAHGTGACSRLSPPVPDPRGGRGHTCRSPPRACSVSNATTLSNPQMSPYLLDSLCPSGRGEQTPTPVHS